MKKVCKDVPNEQKQSHIYPNILENTDNQLPMTSGS